MSTFAVREQLGSTLQNYNFEIFKEPRGIIRILQLVFAFLTALVIKFYTGYITIEYCNKINKVTLPFEFPFDLREVSAQVTCDNVNSTISLNNDFSSEAEFLYATCWISVIYVIIIAFVYVKFREDYESNGSLALVDFVVSVILAVIWIASFGAWGYGQSELKYFTEPNFLLQNLPFCKDGRCSSIVRGNVSGLTESLIFSFLNFFLWAAGLWFLYKETPWYMQYQQRQ